jgi:spore germination cell wall hydrolase CwlJ-like protein
MLSRSKIKPIILCTIIPILVLLIWSLTNNNNNDLNELYVKTNELYVKTYPETVELKKVSEVILINPIKLPPVSEIEISSDSMNKKIPDLNRQEQIKCMAINIYHEAASEPYMGQIAVARVVMNRVLHGFAINPCHVIYQKTKRVNSETEQTTIHCQFSWVCQGKKEPSKDNPQYIQANEIATKVIDHDSWKDEISSNILFFHNTTVNPRWPYYKEFKIGNHIFYSTTDKSKNENTRNTRSK